MFIGSSLSEEQREAAVALFEIGWVPALYVYMRWYNTERISTKLKGLSPVQYRAQMLAA